MTAYDRLVDRLRDRDRKVVERQPGQAMVQCPAHEDGRPSLSVKRTEGQALIYCFAGCTFEDIVAALGFTAADLFDEPRGTSYHYFDPLGTHLRTVTRTPSKSFSQSGPKKSGADAVLYRLPQVMDAVKDGRTIYLVEGEKDVHTLETLSVVATTAPMGAASFHKCDVTPLHGANVIAIVDRDDEGKKWAEQVRDALTGEAASLIFREAKTGKDASDHILAGHDLGDLGDVEVEEPVVFLRRARITWANQIEPEPVVWAWQDGEYGRIPAGSLSIAAGREGTGKSSFGIWKTACITKGTLPGSFYGTPRTVLYVAVEDSWKYTIVPRLMAAGADLSRVGRFEVVTIDGDEVTLSLPHDNELLEQQIARIGVALVVIDPLMSVIGERIDTHREREVRSALDPLAQIADRTGAVITGIAHFNKGSGTDAASLITGSGAFKNVPRSVFGFIRDDSDEAGGRIMTQVKNSLGRDDLPSLAYRIESFDVVTKKGVATTGRLVFLGESDRSVEDVLRDSRTGGDEHGERSEAAEWLAAFLTGRGGSAPAGEAIKAAQMVGISKSTLTRARKAAKVRSVKEGMEGGWLWTLEESTEETEEPRNQKLSPSVPSADGTDLCLECGEPVPAGKVRHGPCYLRSVQRDRIARRTAS